MFDALTASLASMLPVDTITLPLVGVVDLSKAVLAAVVFSGLTVVFWVVRAVVVARLERLAGRTSAQFDDTFVAAVRSIPRIVF